MPPVFSYWQPPEACSALFCPAEKDKRKKEILYYEFGKIANGTSYEMIEGVQEEYKGENSSPEYSDVKSGRKLDYKSLDEIKNKYIGNARPIKVSDADL